MGSIVLKLKNLISIPRPQLFVIPAAVGICGYVLSSSKVDLFGIIFSILIPILIWSGGQTFNDFYDADFDKVYHPEWPIPSGNITKKTALVYGSLFYALGIICSLGFNIYCTIVTLFIIFFSFIYSKLKRKGIYGNICFGICVSLCLLIGSTIAKNTTFMIFYIMLISILIHMSDNIIGTFADMDVDKKLGFNTLPIEFGIKKSARICLLFIIISFIMTLILSGFTLNYFLPLAIIAFISIFWSSLMVYSNPRKFTKISGFWIVYSFFMGEILFYMSFLVGG